jgi:hypothetical protein
LPTARIYFQANFPAVTDIEFLGNELVSGYITQTAETGTVEEGDFCSVLSNLSKKEVDFRHTRVV